MTVGKTLYVTNRKAWRSWLSKHYKSEKDIWLIYYRKDSGKPRIPYNDAVEEALCFGWIDSIVKKIDKQSFVQRFSPRRPKSGYSQLNKERLRKLIAKKKVTKKVLDSIQGMSLDTYAIPDDILISLKTDKIIWKNFKAFPESYKRIRIAFIDGARKRPDVLKQRLNYFLKMTAWNKMYGTLG